ncbi:MAG TPA: alcohol dehydrogenase catalytic domain-containing protein [Terriglobia bacterium]|nr:alcohol dehydrogenase catalytic domain-containing protein [Terriglobia bacterium]
MGSMLAWKKAAGSRRTPNLMRALVFDGKLALRDVDKPIPKTDEALIRVTLAGICGTDREILKGYSAFRGVIGHEFVGRVVESSEAAWIGERVVGEINTSCGECAWCLRGLGRHCPRRTVMGIVNRQGCFAEYVALPLRNLHRVPATIPDEAAVFVEPLAAATEILAQMRLAPGTNVAVLGDGRLGLLVAQVVKNAGAQVTLVGKHTWKLELARSWGVRVMTENQCELQPASVPVVVEATGSPRGLEEALRLVEPRGTVVMKSTFHGPARFDATKLVVDEITLIGSRCGDFSTALSLLQQGQVKVQPLLSKVFPFEESLKAFEHLEKTACLKVCLANQ